VSEEGTVHRALPSLKYAAGGIALPDQLKFASDQADVSDEVPNLHAIGNPNSKPVP
jgi:hypothetical protein